MAMNMALEMLLDVTLFQLEEAEEAESLAERQRLRRLLLEDDRSLELAGAGFPAWTCSALWCCLPAFRIPSTCLTTSLKRSTAGPVFPGLLCLWLPAPRGPATSFLFSTRRRRRW